MDGPPANDWCSVCHGRFRVPCQANCSHWFCGDCIMLVWHHGSAIQPWKCPLCRRQITLLVPGETSQREHHNPEVAEILQKVQAYNRLFGGQTSGLFQNQVVGVFGIVFFLGQLVMKLGVISNTDTRTHAQIAIEVEKGWRRTGLIGDIRSYSNNNHQALLPN
ncbi:E3 ubiquitin-protein ligase RNF170 isoform X1 [Manihot esculenta]|uniref:RING-type domain-containing protein n=1 Tax=Manihot esculenta TaxID=3983 RepID=A0A251ISH8_MANES|nr:E3 ubiquitin-protein ligase RNF170 isoform X1 [Manihot esculenta]